MLDVVNNIVSWAAVFLRASGMLAKKPMTIKLLVSGGNAGWLLSGILTGNIPLIVSNALCLVIMVAEIIRQRKEKNDEQ